MAVTAIEQTENRRDNKARTLIPFGDVTLNPKIEATKKKQNAGTSHDVPLLGREADMCLRAHVCRYFHSRHHLVSKLLVMQALVSPAENCYTEAKA